MFGLDAIGGLLGGATGGAGGGAPSMDTSSSAATLGDFGGGFTINSGGSKSVWIVVALAAAVVLSIYFLKRR